MATLLNTENYSFNTTSRLLSIKEIFVDVARNYDFFYILEGELVLHFNEEVSTLSPGDLFISSPGDAFMVFPKVDQSLVLFLSLDPYDVGVDENSSLRYTSVTKKENQLYAPIHAMYKFYEEEMQSGNEKKAQMIEFLLDKMRPLTYEPVDQETKRVKKIQMIQKAASKLYMPDEEASLDKIAAELDISPSYLSRVFKEVSGMGFSEYSQRKKLELSSALLQEDLTIDKVAEQTGFASTKSLNRIYNHLLNKTPSEYRRELLEMPKSEESQEKLRKRDSFQKFASQFSELSYSKAIKEYLKQDYTSHKLSLNQLEARRNPLGGMAFCLSDFGEDYLEEIQQFSRDGRISGLSFTLHVDDAQHLVFLEDLDRWVRFSEIITIFNYLDTLKIPVMLTLKVNDLSVVDACNDLRREDLSLYVAKVEDFLLKLLQMISRPMATNFLYVFDHSFVLNLSSQRSIGLFCEFTEKCHQALERVLLSGMNSVAYNYGKKTKEEMNQILDFLSKNRHRLRIPSHCYYQLVMPRTIHINEAYLFNQALEEYTNNLEDLKSLQQDPRFQAFNMTQHGAVTKMLVDKDHPPYKELIPSLLCLDYYLQLDPPITSIAKYGFHFSTPLEEDSFSFETQMLNQWGFHTPLSYIAQNLNNMKGDVVYFKNGCVVTKNGEEFNVLLYTHPILDFAFGIEKGFDYLHEYSTDVTLEISGVHGRFKENLQRINYQYGSSFYHLQNFSDVQLMTPREKDYVRSLGIPKMMSDFKDFDGIMTQSFTLSPFEVVFLRYTPI